MFFFWSVLPIIWVVVSMSVFNLPAKKVLPIGLLLTSIISILVWKNSIFEVLVIWLVGTLKAIEILLIIFGAIWLLQILLKTKQIQVIQLSLSNIHKDARVQLLIVGYAFSNFLEGIAGFGTPAAIVAPLLVSLGFTPIFTVIISLIFNSTAVTFGASGTPMLATLGLVEPIDKHWLLQNSVLIHFLVGILVPIVGMIVYLKLLRKVSGWRAVFQIMPFTLLSAIVFLVTYSVSAIFLGVEIPSIVGGLVTILVLVLLAKNNWLTPKDILLAENLETVAKEQKLVSKKEFLKAWFPYLLISLILIITRVRSFGIRDFLSNIKIVIPDFLEVQNLTYNITPLMIPGLLPFLPVCIFCLWFFKAKLENTKHTLRETWKKLVPAIITLCSALALVELLRFDSNSNSDMSSMIRVMSDGIVTLAGDNFIFISPLIGALGAFLTGSSTVSNLLFTSLQLEINNMLNYERPVLVVGQIVGSAFGNMFAISNILAAMATVGISEGEGKILRYLVIVSLSFLTLITLTLFFIR